MSNLITFSWRSLPFEKKSLVCRICNASVRVVAVEEYRRTTLDDVIAANKLAMKEHMESEEHILNRLAF